MIESGTVNVKQIFLKLIQSLSPDFSTTATTSHVDVTDR